MLNTYNCYDKDSYKSLKNGDLIIVQYRKGNVEIHTINDDHEKYDKIMIDSTTKILISKISYL
jgi:ArsR family metal-binding transcriptional regulator